ncbi:MAG: 30S ribosomal protein S4, partial [Nitrospiraceae bacterium]
MEKQFRRLFEEARRHHGLPGENLLALLERRLDNVVYRLSFARTRAMARQLVGHGHVLVNGKRVTVPSYTVQEGDMITLEDEAWNMPLVQQELQQGRSLPSWLTREDRIGRVIGTPRREEIDPDIREDLIVEFYSR